MRKYKVVWIDEAGQLLEELFYEKESARKRYWEIYELEGVVLGSVEVVNGLTLDKFERI